MAVADPGFPVGGGAWTRWGGRGPVTQVLFGKNVYQNERIGSRRGGVRPARPLDPPMCGIIKSPQEQLTCSGFIL